MSGVVVGQVARPFAAGVRWAFAPVPLARVARLRVAVYLIVLLDVLFFVTDPIDHGDVPTSLYRPLAVRDLLHLPAPSPLYVRVLLAVIVVSAIVAASGRWPRVAGWVCALAMLDWLSNGMSYGKVDHDHFALVVALFVLPSVGRAGWSQSRRTEAAGWALRMVQLAAVATYFLSAVAKIREGGWLWGSSATLVWALTRRGAQPTQWLSAQPLLTQLMPWTVFVMELLSPIMLWLRGGALYAVVGFWVLFHASTYLLLTIHFLPTAICLLASCPSSGSAAAPAPPATHRAIVRSAGNNRAGCRFLGVLRGARAGRRVAGRVAGGGGSGQTWEGSGRSVWAQPRAKAAASCGSG